MMAVLVPNINGHIQNQLTRSLERILEEASQSGELKLSNRKLKDFPKTSEKYNLSDTVIADLSKNRFSELPEEVTGFHFLEKLHCYHNAIRFIPDTVSTLQCLSFIDLSRNQLTNLPREICQLPIQILLVSNNRLSCLPDELNRMSQLTELDASCNQLTHLPPRLGDLKSLQSLVLRNNLLLAVPVELTYLKLIRLDLRANRISTLPIEMRDMTSLIDLLVEDNPLSSPPASLCKRGRVHICKFLETEAAKLERKTGGGMGTLSRRSRRSGAGSSPGPPHLADRLKQKRQNVDSGYSTSSDCYEKRWSQEIVVRSVEQNGTHSTLSTPSTISPAPDTGPEEDSPKISNSSDYDKNDGQKNIKEYPSVRLSPCTDMLSNSNGIEDKKPLHQIQTYREYKEALKQQRAQDVPSIYRTKDSDDQSYKTEPNTPTHHPSPAQTLATSKSDPTPLNSAFSNPKQIFDDTSPKKPIQKVTPSRTYSPIHNTHVNGNVESKNGTSRIMDYVKPKSPLKTSTGIMSHDNVPPSNTVIVNGKNTSPRSTPSGFLNGSNVTSKSASCTKTSRNISWNHDVPTEKMSFTMRREIDKAREETDLINQLRSIIETRLKMALPEDLAPALTDGVVLCHLANHIRPRSVASIHVPSPAVPKLTMARCRRNVDNFLEACRKIGVDEGRLCSTLDVTEGLVGRGLPRLLDTVENLCEFGMKRCVTPTQHGLQDTTVSLLLLTLFFTTVALLIAFPPPG
ncbi:leucine-rich repeat and calponin homology domain-containing protein 1 isoform X2 [Anoplophora glabripennis]|uniref:leucine-rich repeat and calponin homology domain-containing protein 1 isoform X2 n=1 Tax=Anoplophora glabripennis TaxID=217634 RepID=UPI000C7725A7|nr:leucine-rich repeat and calponin homology domain-containing protein 1 isoform X2 [Anoplophora glabripennis]